MSDLAGGHCKNLSLTSVTAYASHPHLPYGKTLLVGRVLGCAERSSTHLAARLYTLASALRCHIVQPVVSASTWRCLTILPWGSSQTKHHVSPRGSAPRGGRGDGRRVAVRRTHALLTRGGGGGGVPGGLQAGRSRGRGAMRQGLHEHEQQESRVLLAQVRRRAVHP